MSDAAPRPRWECSRTELAQLLGVSGPVIASAVDAGAPVIDRGGRGRPATYDARAFLAWWIDREKRQAEAAGEATSLAKQEQQLDIALKREKLAQARREHVPRAVLAETLREAMTRLRVAVERMPHRHGPDVVGLADLAAGTAALERIAAAVLAELRAPTQWAPPEDPDEAETPDTPEVAA